MDHHCTLPPHHSASYNLKRIHGNALLFHYSFYSLPHFFPPTVCHRSLGKQLRRHRKSETFSLVCWMDECRVRLRDNLDRDEICHLFHGEVSSRFVSHIDIAVLYTYVIDRLMPFVPNLPIFFAIHGIFVPQSYLRQRRSHVVCARSVC